MLAWSPKSLFTQSFTFPGVEAADEGRMILPTHSDLRVGKNYKYLDMTYERATSIQILVQIFGYDVRSGNIHLDVRVCQKYKILNVMYDLQQGY